MNITRVAMVLVGFSLASAAFVSADQTTFVSISDDFEDGVATEEDWTQKFRIFLDVFERDSNWTVVDDGRSMGNNVWQADNQSPTAGVVAANLKSEKTIDGLSFYERTNNFLVSFDIRYMGSFIPFSAAGGTVLVDFSNQEKLPFLFFGLIPTEDDSTLFTITFFSDVAPDAPFFGLATVNLGTAFDHTKWYRIEAKLSGETINVTLVENDGTPDGAPVEGMPEDGLTGDFSPAALAAKGAVDPPMLDKGASGLLVNSGATVQFDNYMLEGDEITTNTETGFQEVDLIAATVTFDGVTMAGFTGMTELTDDTPMSGAFEVAGRAIDISTTATFTGDITVCIQYDDTHSSIPVPESALQLWHNGEPIPSSVDTFENIICGTTTSLSPFLIGTQVLFPSFVAPLGDDTSEEAPAGPYKRGRTLPIKLQLLDLLGQPVSDEEALGLDVRLQVFYEAPEMQGEIIDPGDNPPDLGNAFRYDADDDLFIFNLSTRNAAWLANFSYGLDVLVDGFKVGEVFFALK